ncbi:MAG: VOC family protein [Rhodobacteraceae bacterium]|nr:VOC family protein [Paracoccaceae bacterium]
MSVHHKIDYVEFPCRSFPATKEFFSRVFGWSYTDYGPGYSAFIGAGIDGGFFASEQCCRTEQGSALIVFYSESLEETCDAVRSAGGQILQEIFAFPGGRRFHFIEPSGNEFAVWSDK